MDTFALCAGFDYIFAFLFFQIDLKGDISSSPVTGLSPKTEYSLSVYAIYPGRIGESATLATVTSGCQIVYTKNVSKCTCMPYPHSFSGKSRRN